MLSLCRWFVAGALVVSVLGQGEEVEGSGEGSGEALDVGPELSPDGCPLDLVLLLDASGSMRGDAFDRQVGWAQSLVGSVGVGRSGTRVAAVMFTGYAHTEFDFDTYFAQEDIVDHLANMRFRSGVTRTGNALKQAEEILAATDKGSRPGAHKLIVLFTDGLSIDDPLPVSDRLRRQGPVTLLTLAVAKNSYMPELLGIAGEEGNVYAEGEIEKLIGRVVEEEAAACVDDPLLPVIRPAGRARPAPVEAPSEALDTTAQPTSAEPSTPAATNAPSTAAPSTAAPSTAAPASTLPPTTSQPPATEAVIGGAAEGLPAKVPPPADATQLPAADVSIEGADAGQLAPGAPDVEENLPVEGAPSEALLPLETGLNPLAPAATSADQLAEEEGSGEGPAGVEGPFPVLDEQPVFASESSIETNISTVGVFAKDTQATIKVTLTTLLSDATTAAGPAATEASTAPPVPEASASPPAPSSTESIVPSTLVRAVSVEEASSSSSEDSAPSVLEESELLSVKAFDESALVSEVRRVPGLGLSAPIGLGGGFGDVSSGSFSPFTAQDCQTDFLVLLDSSGSVQEEFHLQKQLVRDLVDLIEIGPSAHRLAVMQFAGKRIQKLNFPFAEYQSKAELEGAVERIRPILAGTTYLGEAFRQLRPVLQLRRPSARTLVVVISDGYSQDPVAQEALALRRDFGAEFLAVSLAEPANPAVLRRITGSDSAVFRGRDQARDFLNLIRSAQSCLQ